MAKQTKYDDRTDVEKQTDTAKGVALTAGGAASAAAIANQVQKQIVGNRLLNMMYQSQEGKKLLTKTGTAPDVKDPNFNKKDQPKPKTAIDKIKERLSPTTETKATGQTGGRVGKSQGISKTQIRKSATDVSIQEQIRKIVNEEMARVKTASEKITEPFDAATKTNNNAVLEQFKKANPFAKFDISKPDIQSEAFSAFNKYHPNVTYDNANAQHRRMLESAWRKETEKVDPDLNNPEHLKWLKNAGYKESDTPTVNQGAVTKSMTRQQIESETQQGRQAVKEQKVGQPEKVKEAQVAVDKAKTAPRPGTDEITAAREAAAQALKDFEQTKSNANVGPLVDQNAGRVREALASKMPQLVAARRSLIRQYNAAVKDLGPKPQAGTASSSRKALAEWNAKQQALTEMKSQLDTLERVVTKSGGLAPGFEVPTDDMGGRMIYPSIDDVLSGSGRLGNTEFVGNMTGMLTAAGRFDSNVPQNPDVMGARSNFNDALGNYNQLQKQAASYEPNLERARSARDIAAAPVPPYAQPREQFNGGPFSYEVPESSPELFYTSGRDAQDPYANLGARGDIIPERPSSPAMSRDAIFDTGQFTNWMDQYNAELPQVQPRTAVRDTQNLGRLKAIASNMPDQESTGLLARLSKLIGGGVSPSAVSNASNQATIKANNDAALQAFSQTYKRGADLNNPEHVKWLQSNGYTNPNLPVTGEESVDSVLGGRKNITLPDLGWNRRAQAFDAATQIGLRTGSLNPELIKGKASRAKGYAGSIAGGAIPIAAGYLWNRAENDSAEKAAKAQVAKQTAQRPVVQQQFATNAAIERKAAEAVSMMLKNEGGQPVNPTAIRIKTINALRSPGIDEKLAKFYKDNQKDFDSAIETEVRKALGGK